MSTSVVIDASAGVEIVTMTARGRRLARLLPTDATLWVPAHFFSEVFGVVRHLHVVAGALPVHHAESALGRLGKWHLRQAAISPLLPAAWMYRNNMTGADALYVALAESLRASLLTDDYRLVQSPNFPSAIPVLRLPLK